VNKRYVHRMYSKPVQITLYACALYLVKIYWHFTK